MNDLSWETHYTDHADAYEILVSHEGYQGNLPSAIQTLQPLAGSVAAEYSCGTGQVSGLRAKSIRRLH